MTKKILSYQSKAVNAAIEHLQDNEEFKLQSPTGSGKTFIISQIIERYLEDSYLNSNPTTFVFIAPSTGNLDYQGYEKISSYVQNDWAKGYSTQHIGSSKNSKTNNKSYLQSIDYFEKNKCYFIGWQMFKKGTRITEIDSERNNIYRVISNTKARNINIVLIIDEAHREVTSSKDDINTKRIIIEDLDPYKVIKVSATLEEKDIKPDYVITYDEVREEAAIKQNVIISQINEKVKDINKYNEEEQLIISAIEKQKEVKEQLKKKKIEGFNPLILIQIPDKVVIDNEISSEDLLLNRIKSILEKNNYKEGYQYAIWLSDNKTIKEKKEITDDNSSIEILIFKTAIATGWDIPRANILVRIREAKTKSFNIQTLGRILRNPFFKYYGNELIDNAFVYTRDEKYKEYIKQEAIVSDEIESIKLRRSSTSINSTFSLNKVLMKYKNGYGEDKMISYITNLIINSDDFKNKFFKYEEPEIVSGDVKEDAVNVLLSNVNITRDIEKQKQKNEGQTRFNLYKPRETLFDLYIKFRTITRSNLLIDKIVESITNSLYKIDVKIKAFYKACCFNWNEDIFKSKGDVFISLKDWIIKLKDEYLSKYIEQKEEIYELPKEYVVSTKYYDVENWDQVNTFDGSLKTSNLDSENEIKFYESMIEKDDFIDKRVHIFRNGTSPTYDYFIEYIDDDSKIRKFFPDFIVIDEETKRCLVIEGKGNKNNIDRNSRNKFDQFVKCLNDNKIKDTFKCINIVKAYYKKGERMKYINESNNEQIEWKEIMKLLHDK